MSGTFYRGGVDEDGNRYVEELGPVAEEKWGLFATWNGQELFYGAYKKKKTAEKICRRKNRRYRATFHIRKVWTAIEDPVRSRTTYYEEKETQGQGRGLPVRLPFGLGFSYGRLFGRRGEATEEEGQAPKLGHSQPKEDKEKEEGPIRDSYVRAGETDRGLLIGLGDALDRYRDDDPRHWAGTGTDETNDGDPRI